MAYFVFRISYDENFNILHKELSAGRLRQGWGADGMDIRNSEQNFLNARVKNWGNFETSPKHDTQTYTINKYHNLRTMLDINTDDLIIIPKVNIASDFVERYFTVAKCTAKYDFNVLQNLNDFGHIIGVENLFSVPYDLDGDSQIVSGKFRAYQSSVNNVFNEGFKNAIDNLIATHKNNPQQFSSQQASQSNLTILSQNTASARKIYLQAVVNALRTLPPNKFEKIIEELFIKNWHKLIRRNFYNGKGGDVDLVFEMFPENTLMHDIFKVTETEQKIFIQIKKKVGKDLNDSAGINQLDEMNKHSGGNNILILINTTDEFSDEANSLAEEKNVILINGEMLADIIVRRGIDVGI